MYLLLLCVCLGNKKLHFGRSGMTTCTSLVGNMTKADVTPWKAQYLSGKDTKTFTAQIGAAGLDKGYTGITGVYCDS